MRTLTFILLLALAFSLRISDIRGKNFSGKKIKRIQEETEPQEEQPRDEEREEPPREDEEEEEERERPPRPPRRHHHGHHHRRHGRPPRNFTRRPPPEFDDKENEGERPPRPPKFDDWENEEGADTIMEYSLKIEAHGMKAGLMTVGGDSKLAMLKIGQSFMICDNVQNKYTF